jgi:hypothetical protein
MRDQYAGDISDFLKFALLRALAADDCSVGVAWYYNKDHDGRADGRHTDYILDKKWEAVDKALREELERFYWRWKADSQERTVGSLERLSFWPNQTSFHGTREGESVPRFVRDRSDWLQAMECKLASSKLLFLDPDNGVHHRPTIRHATFDDVRKLRSSCRALLLIKFPAFEDHKKQLKTHAESLRNQSDASMSMTLRTRTEIRCEACGSVRQLFRWFTLIDYDATLETRFRAFQEKLRLIPGVSAIID